MREMRILLVDESPVVRIGLAELLRAETDLTVCGEASGVEEALRAIDAGRPDLIVLDLKLQESDGLDLLKQIKRRSNVRVLVCSAYHPASFAERAVRAGAAGFVRKNAPAAAILEAIRTVLAGRVYFTTEIAEQIVCRTGAASDNGAEDPVHTLSDREIQVFAMIGEGMSIRTIAEKLHISPRTVETYRDHIKAKLGLESSNDVIRRAAQWVVE